MADTAVSIGCRKTIEVAGRLTSWLDRSDAMATEIKPVISTALERASLDLRRVMRSLEYSPCVGLVGGPDRHKLDLVAAAVFQDSATISELSQLRNQQQDFATVLGQMVGDDLGTALRFRSANVREPSASANRFPVQVDLFNTLDIIKIIVSAYYAHIPGAAHIRLRQQDIQSAIQQADQQLSTAAVSGLSPEDVSNLRQHLWSQFPRVEGLRTLSTSGYWDWLAMHISHLSLDGRCRILSYLWHFEPRFTALFRRLSEALRDLGYANTVRVPIDALLGADPQTGDVAAHRHSIMRQSTIQDVLRETLPGPDIAVSLGQGTVRNSNRSVIAALSQTVTFRVSRASPFPLDTTDIKLFPSPTSPTNLSLALHSKVGTPAKLEDAQVEQLYGRAKSLYVFSRACTGSELSAVVVLADAGEIPDDVHMQAIADWIELSEGADPRARERMENCLAILVKEPGLDATDGAGAVEALTGPADTFDRNLFVSSLLGEHNRWAQEWTPGRPFSQIHFVPGFIDPNRTSARPLARPSNRVDLEGGIFPARVPTSVSDTLAVNILLDIAANSSQVIRSRQSRRQLAMIQRGMQARMFRYHRSNNPAQFTDWRRQIANVATKRLEACAEARQLGNMLAVLTLSQEDVRMLLAGLKGGAIEFQELDEYSIDIDIGRAALPEPHVCAEATVAAWLKLMHEAAGSRQLCSQLNIAQPVFQHIIDEIVIGVHRADLVSSLTQKFERTLEAGNPLSDLALCYAVVASRTLGGFLERLARVSAKVPPEKPARPEVHLSRGARLHDRATVLMEHQERRAVPEGGSSARDMLATQRAGHDKRQISQWPGLFRRMVDDNIIAAEGLTAHSETDHELGEYLSMLTSNPLEVEL